MNLSIHKKLDLGIHLNNVWIGVVLSLLFISIGITAYTGEFIYLLAPWIALFIKLILESPRILFWIFMICLPLSVEISFANGLSITLPDEPLMVGLLGIVICIIIYNHKILPSWLWSSPFLMIVILQYVWTVVAVMYADDLTLALKFFLAKSWFLASFIFFASIFIKNKNDIKWIALVVAVPVLIHSVFAFLLHASYNFGYWESNAVVRPFYKNHVDYGSVLSMVFPIVYIAILIQKKFNYKKIFLIGIFLFLMVAIFVAFSRAAILAAIFSLIVCFAVKFRLVNWVIPGIIGFVALVIIFLSHNNNFIDFRPNKSKNATQETFIETVVGAFTGQDMSSMERFYRWIASVRMSAENPIVGVGPNNWYNHYKPHSVSSFRTWVSRNEEKSTTHNYFLLMLTEQGWPAMILYGVFIIMLLHSGQKTYHRFSDPIYKYYTLGVVMIVAASFVNNFFSELLETHKVGGIFWLSVTILAFLRHKSLQEGH